MEKLEEPKIKGAEVKRDKNGQVIVAFSSQRITNDQLSSLPDLSENYMLAFYSCDLSECNFEILCNSGVKRMAIIYSKFDRSKFKELLSVKSLEFLKLLDVNVSEDDIREALSENPTLKVT